MRLNMQRVPPRADGTIAARPRSDSTSVPSHPSLPPALRTRHKYPFGVVSNVP